MTDFGYASDGTPVQWTVEFAGESDERGYWQDSWGNPYEVHEVTPARVVGPGQVAVDAADLRAMFTFDVPWAPVADRLRAALAAAEPAPDSGQGEPCNECERDPYPDTESSSDDRAADLLTEIFTGGSDTPAAEPDRVTLPDAGVRFVKTGLTEYEVYAADTGARSLSDLEIAKYADRAAERGRDEALAVVVKALMKIYDWYGDISAPVPVRNLEALARMIERVAGGGGHE